MFLDKKSWVAFIFIFLFVSLNVFAQGTTGRISGTVNDPNGSVVQGATVRVINQATNAEQQTTTGGDGEFAFQLLPAGNYNVEVNASGFQATTVPAVVNITQTTPVNVQLGLTGEKFDKEIPNSQLVVIDRCGHVPQVEKAIEFNAAVLKFLEGR